MNNFDANGKLAVLSGCQHFVSPATMWLTENQVAAHIGCSLSKLRQDRHKCRGIPYTKLGRSVRYALADVMAYMDDNKVTPLQ